MCGIAGVVGQTINPEIYERMLLTMKRRGPDADGIYRDDRCALLHARLAIVDLSGGAQPMELDWLDGRYVISYNGELYNTQELRQELVRLGHRLVTHSDTEVLLHAYAEWKEDCLCKLNGIYAFAVWEKNSRKLFLARDRMGVKPLFYALPSGSLCFASELKTILASELVRSCIDETGIAELLLIGPGRTPGCGVFKDIYELQPGFYGIFENGKLQLCRYWELKDASFTDSLDEALEKVRFLVVDAIKRQMVADVPIGTFLSGGLDSSLITAICARESNVKLPTFSVDYLNNDKYFTPGKFQPESDSEYISIMKEEFQTDHSDTILTPDMLDFALESATDARDLPGMGDVDFSLLAFCEKIRKKVKVALSGECADEIFGGYPWFRDQDVLTANGFPWAQNTTYRASFLTRTNIQYEAYVRSRYEETVRQTDVMEDLTGIERSRKIMMNLNIRWFMQTLLDRKDRMSMYHGLEVRVPFCDHRIAEYLYQVPWKYKEFLGREKGLLRKAMEGYLPERVLWRKKSPYPKTYDPKYTTLMENRLHILLQNRNSPIFEIVKRDRLHSLLADNEYWPWYGQLMKKPQTIAYFLQIDYWLNKYQVDIL